MEIQPLQTDVALGKALPVPFWQVQIHRPMRQFSTALGLKPGVSGIPSLNVAAAILFGRTSFKAVLRRELGDNHFRNLNNYAAGSVRSPRALRQILAKIGGNEEWLEMLVQMLRAPDTGAGWEISGMIEGVLYRSISALRQQQIPCPCCGAKRSVVKSNWWEAQRCEVGAAEAAFMDRVCMAAIGLHFLVLLRGRTSLNKGPGLLQLAQPHQHPNKNWLELLKRALGAPSLSHLSARAGATLTADTILRCSRGEMLTDHSVDELTSDLINGAVFKESAVSVRTLSLAIEFLLASERSGAMTDERARELVALRVGRLLRELAAVMDSLAAKFESQRTRQ